MLKRAVVTIAVLFSFMVLAVPAQSGALEKAGKDKSRKRVEKTYPFKRVSIKWAKDRVWLVDKKEDDKYYLFMVVRMTPAIKASGLRLGDLVSANKHALYYPKGSLVGIKHARLAWAKKEKLETPYFVIDANVLLKKRAICWRLVKGELATIDFSIGRN